MTIPLLNYASSPFRFITGNTRFGAGYGSIAVLPAEQFDRLLYRVALVTSLTSADITNPASWDDYNSTAITWFLMGGIADNNAIIDATYLGDENVVEYVIPVMIPARTDFYIRWTNVLAASAGKCNATLSLVTA